MIDSSLKRKWDNKSVLDYAIKQAKYQANVNVALRMKEYGMPATEISKYTELSIEEIEKL